MKCTLKQVYEITAEEGKRWLTLDFADGKCFNCDSNLPYEKSVDDWEFYWKAIRRILQVLKKE